MRTEKARAAAGRASGLDHVNPLMVILARESRGLSQTKLASDIGVTQGTLSKIESGLMLTSDDVVERLAERLAYPQSFFFQSHQFRQLPTSFFRKRKRLASRDVRAIRAKINIARLRIEHLCRAVELPEPRLVLADIRRQGATPESVAALLRVRWHLPPGPLNDLTATIEAAGVLVVPCDFGTSLVDGVSLYEPDDTLPPMIFISPDLPGDRMRWTLAHELAHIVLHHHLAIPRDDDAMEDEAHRLAAELLMPAKEIRGQLGSLTIARLAALKRHWGVSMRAILRRAEQLGRITARQARYLWTQLGKMGGTTEPVTLEPERPKVIRSLIEKHLNEYGYTLKEMASMLHQASDEFRAEYLLHGGPLRLA